MFWAHNVADPKPDQLKQPQIIMLPPQVCTVGTKHCGCISSSSSSSDAPITLEQSKSIHLRSHDLPSLFQGQKIILPNNVKLLFRPHCKWFSQHYTASPSILPDLLSLIQSFKFLFFSLTTFLPGWNHIFEIKIPHLTVFFQHILLSDLFPQPQDVPAKTHISVVHFQLEALMFVFS